MKYLTKFLSRQVEFERKKNGQPIEDQFRNALKATVEELVTDDIQKILILNRYDERLIFILFSFWWYQDEDKKVTGDWVKNLVDFNNINCAKNMKNKVKNLINKFKEDTENKIFNFTHYACRDVKDLPIFFKVLFEKNGNGFQKEKPDCSGGFKCLIQRRRNSAEDATKNDYEWPTDRELETFFAVYQENLPDAKSFYFIPAKGVKTNLFDPYKTKETSSGGLILAFTEDPDENFEKKMIPQLATLVSLSFNRLALVDFLILKERNENEIRKHSLMSAISAIMSRNMSHNIGSHVLINLEKSSNGTDADDIKQFLSYLRKRMDFLAQISTSWPSWSLPTRFLQDLMYDYFQQICLLRYIGASESLNDKKLKMFFYFDDKKVLGPCNPSDKTELERLKKNLLKKDIWISVVGGVTGRQAFYVMLENIIRNAAKHSYNSYNGTGDLEIHINIKAEKDEYCIEIWDNVSKADKGLPSKINKMIEQSIISEIGEVQKGNWGIAEMKISAAYLQKVDYNLLGQEGKNNEKIISAETSKDGSLKYVFQIPKPKEVAIVDMRGEKEELSEPEGNSIVLKKTADEFALMDTVDANYEFMLLFPDAASTEEILKKLVDNKGILLEKLPTRLFWVGNKALFDSATASCPYIKKRIAVLELDTDGLTKKLKTTEFRLWLYVEWIKHIRDNVRGDDIVKGKKFHLYLKLTEEVGANQYNSDYIKDYYSYFIPPLVQISNDFDSDAKDQWQRLKNTVNSKNGSILSEIIEDVLIHESVPNDDLPIIAYPRHGAAHDENLSCLIDKKDNRLIYSEHLSGASPHFNILASPPTNDYQLKKLALWLIEGGLLRIAIADERIGKEICDDLKKLSIINIAKLTKNDIKTPVSVSSAGQKIYIYDEDPYMMSKEGFNTYTPLMADVLIIHQGVIDKMVNAKFWKGSDDVESWIFKLKERIPFVIVTSGRGKPDEIPKGVKYVPFSDISQSFASKHSTKFLLTYILMHARE